MTGFYWGPDRPSHGEGLDAPSPDERDGRVVGTARLLGSKPVATQWCEQLTMQHVYDLLATCQRRGMQWREAALLPQQRLENGRLFVRLVVLEDQGSVYD